MLPAGEHRVAVDPKDRIGALAAEVGVVAEGRGALQGHFKEIRIIDHAGRDGGNLPGAADELEEALIANDQSAFGAMGHKVAAAQHMGLKA